MFGKTQETDPNDLPLSMDMYLYVDGLPRRIYFEGPSHNQLKNARKNSVFTIRVTKIQKTVEE